MKKKITAVIYLENGKPISDLHTKKIIEGYENAESLAKYYSDNGADAIFVLDMTSESDEAHEKNIGAMKDIIRVCDVPVYAGGIVKRFEDVKKYLYTGALKALCWFNEKTVEKEIKEAFARFGKDKLIAVLNQPSVFVEQKSLIEEVSDAILLLDAEDAVVADISGQTSLSLYIATPDKTAAEWLNLLKNETICGVTGPTICEIGFDFMAFKFAGKANNISMNFLESKINWDQLKLNADGMIPVIVQDYKTDEVLQLAYMNEESFKETLACGKMTYWSRSRDELWTKGETSGHFQYVKSLTTDCDYDTILAKVSQVGAACHTGKRSCFFNEMVKTEYQDTNPLKVFQDVYDVILNRKLNPKEGSYTNYLFNKGIDKILKKVGEEATEIVIAAKNPDAEEIKYEMSDFLYHAMVLMVERGVTWEDITRELAQR